MNKFTEIGYIHGLLTEVQQVLESEGESDRLYSYPLRNGLTEMAKIHKQLSGKKYIDRIERSVIYYIEGTHALNEAIANYLYCGRPLWNGVQIRDFSNNSFQELLSELVNSQVNFINAGCNGCSFHQYHQKFSNLKKMKKNAQKDYLEEIEYSFIFYFVHLELNKIFLSEFLPEYYLAGVASLLGEVNVINAVSSRTKMITALASGTMDLGIDMDENGNLRTLSQEELARKFQKKRTWRDFWGSEFDKILRTTDSSAWYKDLQTNNQRNEKPDNTIITKVVGVTFDNRQETIKNLSKGQPIILVCEPHNPYDENAISVRTEGGKSIGYIRRDLAYKLAPQVDRAATTVRGKILAITGGDEGYSYGVNISFSLKG